MVGYAIDDERSTPASALSPLASLAPFEKTPCRVNGLEPRSAAFCAARRPFVADVITGTVRPGTCYGILRRQLTQRPESIGGCPEPVLDLLALLPWLHACLQKIKPLAARDSAAHQH